MKLWDTPLDQGMFPGQIGSLLNYSVVTVLAGTVAGLIGIGGGVCLGPVLLHWGLNPRVSRSNDRNYDCFHELHHVALIYVTIGLVP